MLVYMKVSQNQHPCHTEMTSFHVSLSLVNLVLPCWLDGRRYNTIPVLTNPFFIPRLCGKKKATKPLGLVAFPHIAQERIN